MRKAGVDAGCAYTKVVAFDNNNQLIQLARPSIIVRGKSATDLQGNKAPSYLCEGQQWSVLEHSSKAEPTTMDNYPYSNQNTVLIHHALKAAGIHNDQIQLSTSIPLEHYFSDMDGNKQRKRQSIQKQVTDLSGQTLPQIDHRVTVPEGLAGWIDMCYSFNGQKLPDVPNGPVGLVDVGGRTTDLVVVNGLSVEDDTINTLSHGFLNIFEHLNELINQRFPDTGKFAIHTLDQAMEHKTIEIESGKVVDISELVSQSLNNFTHQLMDDVNRVLGSGKDLLGVCYFGGGVEHLRDVIVKQPKTFIPDNPQFANARGSLKAFWI